MPKKAIGIIYCGSFDQYDLESLNNYKIMFCDYI